MAPGNLAWPLRNGFCFASELRFVEREIGTRTHNRIGVNDVALFQEQQIAGDKVRSRSLGLDTAANHSRTRRDDARKLLEGGARSRLKDYIDGKDRNDRCEQDVSVGPLAQRVVNRAGRGQHYCHRVRGGSDKCQDCSAARCAHKAVRPVPLQAPRRLVATQAAERVGGRAWQFYRPFQCNLIVFSNSLSIAIRLPKKLASERQSDGAI